MKSRYSFIQLLCLLFISTFVHSQVGSNAPDFTVTDTQGHTHRLYDYLEAGKVVVLDFFYTTCTPCQFYSPQANLAYEKYGCNTANVIFLSIDFNDTDEEVEAYDDEYNILYPDVSGLDGGGNAVVNQYNIIGFPTFYVIDSTKKIIDDIDPPTLQVFDFRFHNHGIEPATCKVSAVKPANEPTQAKLYPNPIQSNESLFVEIPGVISSFAQYEIIDFTGVCIRKGMLDLSSSHPAELNTDLIGSGNYLLKINPAHEKKTFTVSFIKI